MKKQLAAACLLGTALVSGPVLAQETTTSAPANPPGASQAESSQAGAGAQFLTEMNGEEWRGSKLVGVDVYGSDNSKIGDINEVIVDRKGQVRAIVIGVGGFLGIGEKNVAIPWDKVQWNVGGNQTSSASTSGGQPAGDRSSPRDIAQTTTGSPSDPNAQPVQAAAAGGASLSSAPSSGTTGNAPANSSASVASAPSSSSTSSGSSAGPGVTASGSTHAQDYPDRALVSMSKQDLQKAPEFHYASQASSASGSAKGGAGGSSLTGSSGSTSGR